VPDHRHFAILEEGVEAWNTWRDQNPGVRPGLRQAYLLGKRLLRVNLSDTDLAGAAMTECFLYQARLDGAILDGAKLSNVDLCEANLTGAKIRQANLEEANLLRTNLSGADLSGSSLVNARLVGTNFRRANLTGCFVYGISAWDVNLTEAHQQDLVISRYPDLAVTTDNLELAQFLYLLLNNQTIRHVIDTITSKVVLILGRFTPNRKAILDAIREELRKRDYVPVLFDFEKPSNRDITETVSTLAHMARFVIADITDAKSIPQELMRIVPALPSVPVQPLLLASQQEYGMFEHFKRFPWVLEPFLYTDQDELLAVLTAKVIGPAETKAREQIEAQSRVLLVNIQLGKCHAAHPNLPRSQQYPATRACSPFLTYSVGTTRHLKKTCSSQCGSAAGRRSPKYIRQ
jgi:uncharacterized protein YjbI with pentapeptide repeats